MFCQQVISFFFIGTYPNVYPYSSLPVATCTVSLYIYRWYRLVVYRSSATTAPGQNGVRSTTSDLPIGTWTLPLPSRSTLYPSLRSMPYLPRAPVLGWDADNRPCYHPQIPRPNEVGLDPRVCVHPTVLPPKKNSCHLIWRSSTSSVVNLK